MVVMSVSGPYAPPVQKVEASEHVAPNSGTLDLVVLSKPVFVQFPDSTNQIEITDTTIAIPERSIVQTGAEGRAELRYPNKSVTRMNFNTKVEVRKMLQSPQQSRIAVIKGTIWNRINKLLGREAFETETGSMVATVRGTAYQMEVSDDGTSQVKVESGSVGIGADKEEYLLAKNNKISFANEISSQPVIEEYYPDPEDEWQQFNQKSDVEWIEQNKGFKIDQPEEPAPVYQQTPYIPVYLSPTPVLLPCIGPDNKHFRATKQDCDNLNNFWNRVNPKK